MLAPAPKCCPLHGFATRCSAKEGATRRTSPPWLAFELRQALPVEGFESIRSEGSDCLHLRSGSRPSTDTPLTECFSLYQFNQGALLGRWGALGPGHQGKTVYRGNQLPTYAFIPCREGTKNAPGRVPVLKSTLDLLDARNVPTPHRRCPGFPGRNVLCVGRQGATHPTPRVPCLSIFAPFKKRASRCAMTS